MSTQMITYIKEIPNWESLSAQEIADILNADKRTVNPIDLGALLFLMNDRGMLTRLMYPDADGIKWEGTVVNMLKYVRNNVPEFAPAINKWFSHITNDRNVRFGTNEVEYAASFNLIRTNFQDNPTMPTTADFQAMVDLGGGYLFNNVTAEQVTEELEAEAERVAAEELKQQKKQVEDTLFGAEWNTHVASVLDGPDPTVAGVIAGLRALADALEGV